jgi:hypothetical protein
MIPVSKKYIISAASVCVGGLALLGLLHSFVIGPKAVLANELENQISDKKAEYKTVIEIANPSAKEALERKFKTVCDRFDSFVIKHSEVGSLALHIKQIAGEVGVEGFSSKNKTINSYEKIGGCKEIEEGRILVNFKGSFAQFAEFVNKLERNKPVVFVDTFTVTHSAKTESKHSFSMVLIFFVKKKQAVSMVEDNVIAIICDSSGG